MIKKIRLGVPYVNLKYACIPIVFLKIDENSYYHYVHRDVYNLYEYCHSWCMKEQLKYWPLFPHTNLIEILYD